MSNIFPEELLKMPSIWTSRPQRLEPAHDEEVTALAFSEDTSLLASASWDKTIQVWTTSDCKRVSQLVGHEREVTALAFAPARQRLASASFDGTCRIWEATAGSQIQCLIGQDQEITSIVYSPDGTVLAAASRNFIRLWDTMTGQQRNFARVAEGIAELIFSPNGNLLLSIADRIQTVRIWDTNRGTELQRPVGHTQEMSAPVAFSPDESVLISKSRDSTIQLWNSASWTSTTRNVVAPKPKEESVDQQPEVLPSPNEQRQRLAAPGGPLLNVKPEIRRGHVSTIAYSRNGQMIAIGYSNGMTQLWDSTMREVLHELDGHKERVTSLHYSPSGRILVSVAGEQEVNVWNTITGDQLYHLQDDHLSDFDAKVAVAFTSENHILVAMPDDKAVMLYKLTSDEDM